MTPMKKFLKNYPMLILSLAVSVFFAVNLRMNLFSYNNFDMGKFDLGNMTQMLWNTQHGKFMYLTDYFGTNLPRWSMSHVDPILLLFLPIFMLFPSPLTLVYSQVLILLLASFLLYGISYLNTKSRFISLILALAYLCYPALGFLTAKTGFHGVTAAVPFFLLTFYIYELMYHTDVVTTKRLLVFWFAALITILGKEQIALYTFLFSLYIILFRLPTNNKKRLQIHAIILGIISLFWFMMAFFVIIPAFAYQRVEGYQKFAQSLNIENKDVRNVGLANYFLSRYEAFGDSYSDIISGIILKPDTAIRILFGGDKLENFKMTLSPILYMPFLAPQIAILAVPDLLMNYLTSTNGIGTSEIQNHRISMIIPVLFLTVIFSVAFIKRMLQKYHMRNFNVGYLLACAISVVILFTNISSSFEYTNPVFLWLRDSIQKHIPQFISQAKFDKDLSNDSQLKVGDVIKVSPLENKDRECAQKVVELIPDNASVSGPDYLGAHLSMRETYAIFPALYNRADYVIIDVFSKKIANILDLPPDLINDVVNRVIKDPNYKLQISCGNLFVYERVAVHEKSGRLPIQELFRYLGKYDFTMLNGLTVVDYKIPSEIERGKTSTAQVVYLNKDKLSNNFIFMSFINLKTGYIYQSVNLPSFAVLPPEDWKEDYYYIEDLELVLPSFLEEGDYRVFVGMSNNIRTRSVYLGDITLK